MFVLQNVLYSCVKQRDPRALFYCHYDVHIFMNAWMDEQIIGFNRTRALGSTSEIIVTRNMV